MTKIVTGQGFSRGIFAVLYDRDGKSAVRVWWLMQYYGHTRVSVLQGGMNRWKEQNRPMELKKKVVLASAPETAFSAQIQRGMVVGTEELERILSFKLQHQSDIREVQAASEPACEQVVQDAVRICERAIDQKKVLSVIDVVPTESNQPFGIQLIDARILTKKPVKNFTKISYQHFFENGQIITALDTIRAVFREKHIDPELPVIVCGDTGFDSALVLFACFLYSGKPLSLIRLYQESLSDFVVRMKLEPPKPQEEQRRPE